MQDRYTGDIGDLAKHGLLRALSRGRQLGVAWYLYPDEANGDGGFIEYLNNAEVWEPLDPELFGVLHGIIDRWQRGQGPRCVAEIENSGLLPGAEFANECLETDIPPGAWPRRRDCRASWFERVMDRLSDCNIVFADPDNGLCKDAKFSPSRIKDWKKLPICEALQLSANGRPAVFYHHNSRFPGGHPAEIRYWMQQLPGCTHAFRVRRYNSRTFFIVNPDQPMIDALMEFEEAWRRAEQRLGIRRNMLSEIIPA